MKKIGYAFVAVMTVTLLMSSCEKVTIIDNRNPVENEDDNNEENNNDNSSNDDNQETATLGDELKKIIEGKWSAFCWDSQFVVIVDFNSSGTYSSHQYYVSDDVKIIGDTVNAKYVDDMGVFTGEWKIQGNQINFIYNDDQSMMGDQDWQITAVSLDKFNLRFDYNPPFADLMEFNRIK